LAWLPIAEQVTSNTAAVGMLSKFFMLLFLISAHSISRTVQVQPTPLRNLRTGPLLTHN